MPKATQKRYKECQANPALVMQTGSEVRTYLDRDGGVMVSTLDGRISYRIHAHMHHGNLVLDITTPDNSPAIVVGKLDDAETPRRKIMMYQGNLGYLAELDSPEFNSSLEA